MVRNIAGALADAGTGKLTREDLREILEAKDRKFLGATAPAHGLCLLKVYFAPVTKELMEKQSAALMRRGAYSRICFPTQQKRHLLPVKGKRCLFYVLK